MPLSQRSAFSTLAVAIALLLMAGAGRAAILDPMTAMRDDVSRIKVMMETVGEQLERFNGLYLSKLETRLMTSATSLAHIDSNVKNLQERAYVWDTFQLHVAAWNEQIKSVDKKLDILSRGAEKWELLDEKVAVLLPLDDKLTKMMAKLEETDAKVAEIQRKMNSCGGGSGTGGGQSPAATIGEAPLFSEFTSRGVLSALKDIEIKVNKIASDRLAANAGSASQGSAMLANRKEERELQQRTLDVVNDVAGKVDFILDKMVVKKQNSGKQSDDGSEDVYDDGDSDYHSGSAGGGSNGRGDGGEGGGSAMNQAERSFVKVWRRMLQPVRRANKRFETLDKVLAQLDRAANGTAMARRDDRQLRDDVASILECCRGNDANLRGLVRAVEALGDTVRAGQTDENRCAAEADLQARLQHSSRDIVRQIGELVKEQVNSGAERVRQSCVGQRKKSTASHVNGGTGNGTLNNNSDEESTTEGVVHSQGQATPVGPDMGSHGGSPESGVMTTQGSASSSSSSSSSGGVVGGASGSVDSSGSAAINGHQHQSGKIGLRGCHDLRLTGETESRIYSLASGKELNEGGRDYNTRYCDMTTDGGGWTVIQRRGDYGLPRENFSVSWRDYKLGFGQLDREFWLGNDFIHRLTNEHDVVLRVELWDFDDGYVVADYESFRVDSEEDLYRLWVEGYQGNATDSLGSHNGYAFSTFDRDNDEAPPCCPCAPAYGGGWWFYSCFEANLNGEYHVNPVENDYFRGIIWELWRGDYSLRMVEMKIRPHDFPRMLPQLTTTTTTTPLPPDVGPEDTTTPEDP